jgi:hypothetical protein
MNRLSLRGTLNIMKLKCTVRETMYVDHMLGFIRKCIESKRI